jgi:hypothetical protein
MSSRFMKVLLVVLRIRRTVSCLFSSENSPLALTIQEFSMTRGQFPFRPEILSTESDISTSSNEEDLSTLEADSFVFQENIVSFSGYYLIKSKGLGYNIELCVVCIHIPAWVAKLTTSGSQEMGVLLGIWSRVIVKGVRWFVDSSVGILEDIVRSTRGSSFSSRKRRRTYSSHALALEVAETLGQSMKRAAWIGEIMRRQSVHGPSSANLKLIAT